MTKNIDDVLPSADPASSNVIVRKDCEATSVLLVSLVFLAKSNIMKRRLENDEV